jgi:hypothetical protein
MPAVTTSEIAAARADLATMLPDTCTIQRAVKASDGGGGESTSWPELATEVPCRLTPAGSAGSGTGKAGDRLNDTTTHIVTFTAGQDVQQGDRIIVNTIAYQALVVGSGGVWELSRHVEVRPVA